MVVPLLDRSKTVRDRDEWLFVVGNESDGPGTETFGLARPDDRLSPMPSSSRSAARDERGPLATESGETEPERFLRLLYLLRSEKERDQIDDA